MTSLFFQLLRPAEYLRIRHSSKLYYDIVFPGGLVLVGLLLVYGPLETPVFGNGIVLLVVALLQFIAGFFIAALAAVATFGREDMDERLQGEDAILPARKDEGADEELTFRRFLSFLFGYLALASIGLYFVGSLSLLTAPALVQLVPEVVGVLLKLLFCVFFFFTSAHVVTTTLLGLSLLSERMVRAKPRVVPLKKAANS